MPPCGHRRAPLAPASNSVAVLYFDNVSRDTADSYLADGVTQQIIERLSRLERLTVSSRFAVGRFRGGAMTDPSTVGRALGVQYLVAGSVQRAGARLRVSAELLRASTGVRTWGETYDRGAGDVLAIQDEIAQAVATGIAGRLLTAERSRLTRRPTRSAAANDHLLRGDYLAAQRNSLALRQAISEYEAAARLDPAFAEAFGHLAYAWYIVANWGWGHPGLRADSIRVLALRAARLAVRLDSLAPLPFVVLGKFSPDPAERMALLRRAVALGPGDPEALHALGGELVIGGALDEATTLFTRAVVIDPQRTITLTWLGITALWARRYDAAILWLDSALVVAPDFYLALAYRAVVRAERGESPGAERDAREALSASRGDTLLTRAVLAYVRARGGDTLASQEARLLPQNRGTIETHAFVAAALLHSGGRDAARVMVQQLSGQWGWFFLKMPMFEALRGDSTYERAVQAARAAEGRRP
jgi:TolB-like protein